MAAFAALEKAEHVVDSLSQIGVGADFREGDSMWEPVDCEDIPALGSGQNVAFVASVVIEGRAHVPAIDAMGSHVGSLRWSDVGNDSGAWRGKGCVQKIERLVEAGVGR